jgi:hypothetical protein
MGQYKVPQNVEAEDKILGPLTFRQFIYALMGVGWAILCFALLHKIPAAMIILGAPPTLLLMLLAFYTRDGQNFEQLLIAMVGFFAASRRRLWVKEDVAETFHIEPTKHAAEVTQRNPAEVISELEKLAVLIDSRGWNRPPQTESNLVQPTTPHEDRMVAPPPAPHAPDEPKTDMLDLQQSPLAQNLAELLRAAAEDGVVVMRDGSLRGVILGSAINFDLMSPGEQESVEYAYQSFLNSLHFPVQIVIKSQKIDITPYLEKLDGLRNEQPNELLGALMDDYIANIRALVEEVNIMDKQFYIVVPFFPALIDQKKITLVEGLKSAFEPTPVITVSEEDFRKYKQELSQRMALAASGLTQMGIRAISLGTQELVDLYYAWYNPDVAANQKLIDVAQLGTPLVQKGDGTAPRGPLPGAPV